MKLDELRVLVVDCQTSGATPAQGDLLELGWAVTDGLSPIVPARAEWTRTTRPVSRIVRKLTGWDDSAQDAAIEPAEAWARMLADAPFTPRLPPPGSLAAALFRPLELLPTRVCTVIHFARFELSFLQHLHGMLENAGRFPLDVVCLHGVAERLFPNLPRRNLRALAGTLGGAPDVLRSAGPHAEVTALVWRAVLPRLAAEGVTTWDALQDWLAVPSSRPRAIAREFPLPVERRRALPDAPGVYRFLRPNGDVLYVGKAASLRKRIASHYTTNKGARATERSLEMLSQVHDVDVTEAATALEAALVEVDEIKRLDPPYNVHLRAAERSAWFATRDWQETAPEASSDFALGPLPARSAIHGIAAMRALLEGASVDASSAAAATGVPASFTPPLEMFTEEWSAFAAAELSGARTAARAILAASQRLVVQESPDEEDAPDAWDRATIRRYLERVVVNQGTLLRRARLLALLSHARVTFREPAGAERVLAIADGVIGAEPTGERPPPRHTRVAAFDASRYDRLRVLATELRRVATQGGAAEIRVGRHFVPF